MLNNVVNHSASTKWCFSFAKAVLLLIVATVYRRFGKQELFETTRADVDFQHDLLAPRAAFDSKGRQSTHPPHLQ
jgi:hypothetical protein